MIIILLLSSILFLEGLILGLTSSPKIIIIKKSLPLSESILPELLSSSIMDLNNNLNSKNERIYKN